MSVPQSPFCKNHKTIKYYFYAKYLLGTHLKANIMKESANKAMRAEAKLNGFDLRWF